MSEEKVNTAPIDRTGWEEGPWKDEKDRYEWRNYHLPCLIVRNDHGNLCGYVGVPPGHPWHGKDYSDLEAECHGGLTYSDKCQPGGRICHVARPGEPHEVWWLGFDCGHSCDLTPKMEHLYKDIDLKITSVPNFRRTYRDVEYVTNEVNNLAQQAVRCGTTRRVK